MPTTSSRSHGAFARRTALTGISVLAVAAIGGGTAAGEPLKPPYSPARNNGGGANPGRADIITQTDTTGTITGDYTLRRTSARRFRFNAATLAQRQANGEVVSGYEAIDGRVSVELGPDEKRLVVTIPDQIKGTNVTALVYDNARLGAVDPTAQITTVYYDTRSPVYGDLRLADIANSTVTIATGSKAKSVYDTANYAIVTADSGSTLYSLTAGSNVTYDSRTATMSGIDQDGFSQRPTRQYQVLVTSFSGLLFGTNDAVTDLASLRRYNTSLIAQLQAGQITPAEYEGLMQAAAITTTQTVVVRQDRVDRFDAPPTTSERLFARVNASTFTTTADSQLVGMRVADSNTDGGNTLILAENGAAVTNNGNIAQAGVGPAIRVDGAGTTLTNSSTGVIGIGYEVIDRTGGTLRPTGVEDRAYTTDNAAIVATNGAAVSNAGIINVANRDIATEPNSPEIGKANVGVVVGSGSTASNTGTILIGGGQSAAANQLGSYDGAAGLVALAGGTATNAAGGTIRVGTTFAETAADLAGVTDVLSINPASGMTSLSGGTLTNAGAIRVGGLAQNATGMKVGGDGSTATNSGAIILDPTGVNTPTRRNAAIAVRGSSVLGAVNATNTATGTITVGGVNSVGLLVANNVAGGSARAVNDGTITVSAGFSPDRLRSYAIYVANDTSSARDNGAVILGGEGAIGVHARNGGSIDVGSAASMDFRNTGQIGYYALGAGSSITGAITGDVDTAGSTGFRIEGGATGRGTGLVLTVSGANANGVVATGASTGMTFDATGASLTVSGAGAAGIVIEGGATGMIGDSDIRLTGAGTTAAIVDRQGRDIDGVAAGAPVATSLASSARLASETANVTGYVVRNGAQLTHSGVVAFTGANGTGIVGTTGATIANSGTIGIGGGASFGIDLSGAGTTATHSGTLTGSGTGVRVTSGATFTNSGAIGVAGTGIDVSGAGSTATHGGTLTGSGTGVRIANGGAFTNNGGVALTSGTGILVDGATSTLTGTGTGAVSVDDGTGALRLVNGGTVTSAGSFTAGGTAHGVLVDTGAGALTLGGGTVTSRGTGNGIENAANSAAIRLNGTTVVASGSGAAVRTAVALDPASTATLTAAGANSTGFAFTGAAGAAISGDLALGPNMAISSTGVGATGVRLNTSGNVTLGGTITVANASGGAAVVGGPAATLASSGTLRSASTTTAVVDLTGGTRAFTNTGTIAAASATATAIQGGNSGQSVTLTSGPVTGAVALGTGADTFLMTGGTLAGAFTAGGGNDTATFRGLTDANLSGVTTIGGNGVAGGTDALVFDATTSTGTRRLTGWNTVGLTNASTLTSDGDLVLAGGTMTVGAGSTYRAGNAVRGAVSAATGATAAVVNAGVIDLTNGDSGATDTLTVRGNYTGQNGVLRLQTVLASDGSPSDRLIIDGGTVSGTTSIQISNAGGLGARTNGDGIEVVTGINGANTTALTTGTGFTLAGEHVDAGAFEYRLYASNLAGTNQNWYLRTQANNQTEVPTDPGTPGTPDTTYRVDVPLLAALPGTLRRGDLAMLGTYHQRMGDETGTVEVGWSAPGRLWGRVLGDSGRFRQRGDTRPTVDGRVYGFQLGLDVFRFGADAGHHDVGVYGGYLDGRFGVQGFAGGVENRYVGSLDTDAKYAGLYWTYLADSGLYVDTVVQHSWYGGRTNATNGNRADVDGTGVLASVEGGYAVPLSQTWVIEPQVQVIAQGSSIDPVAIPNALVTQASRGQVTGRIGLRTRARYELGQGSVQPYFRANLWKSFRSTDRTIFTNGATSTVIYTPNGALWGEAGAGLTWSIAPNVAIYGEADRRFNLDDQQGTTGHSTRASVGVKVGM